MAKKNEGREDIVIALLSALIDRTEGDAIVITMVEVEAAWSKKFSYEVIGDSIKISLE